MNLYTYKTLLQYLLLLNFNLNVIYYYPNLTSSLLTLSLLLFLATKLNICNIYNFNK